MLGKNGIFPSSSVLGVLGEGDIFSVSSTYTPYDGVLCKDNILLFSSAALDDGLGTCFPSIGVRIRLILVVFHIYANTIITHNEEMGKMRVLLVMFLV